MQLSDWLLVASGSTARWSDQNLLKFGFDHPSVIEWSLMIGAQRMPLNTSWNIFQQTKTNALASSFFYAGRGRGVRFPICSNSCMEVLLGTVNEYVLECELFCLRLFHGSIL
jgi:hypothetical protein